MQIIKRTNPEHPEFKKLVQLLNTELGERDGFAHPLAQFNEITKLKHVVIIVEDGKTIACGAISKYDNNSMEIKRMFVEPKSRGQKLGEKLLAALESWAVELGFSKCILFTGSKQPEAIKLYQTNGYLPIEKYGKLKDIPDSRCFAKQL